MKYKQCESCESTTAKTSYSKLKDRTKKYICRSCYQKSLPTCNSCGYRKRPFSYTLQKKALCRICSIEVTRVCKQCKRHFPAGKGNICPDCVFQKSLDNKVSKIASRLSPCTNAYFVEFSQWLRDKRGVNFTSVYIENYQEYFLKIDTLCQKIKRFPTYNNLLITYPYATSKSYFLIHTFLEYKNLIKVDKKIQKKYANLNLINKLLDITFHTSNFQLIIRSYYQKLQHKLNRNSISLLTLRLSLSSAIKFLQYCEYFKNTEPSMYALEGYLWINPGQKSSLTEFTNFLKNQYGYNLMIINIKRPSLSRPRVSHQILQKRLAKIMQKPVDKFLKIQNFYKIAFGYLHWVFIPNNVYLSCSNIKKDSNKDFYIQMCAQKFYLPKEIVKYAINLEKIHINQLQAHGLS